uniref:hypothetical protein n=1 Tax=Burkholderia vietnamiensis TaxID=60552 RepID=UPI0018C7E9AE|nr:hypothetical protein [Burkholderia vietnamiensis]
MPYQIIDDLAATLAKLSDAEVLDKLVAVPPLADEAGPCWNDKEYWRPGRLPVRGIVERGSGTEAAGRRSADS